MYNQFASSYNEALNEAFGVFRDQNITELAPDLRYNRGGSVSTCTYLASMITGQFSGEIFAQFGITNSWNTGKIITKKVYTTAYERNS